MFVVAGFGVGGYFAWRAFSNAEDTDSTDTTTELAPTEIADDDTIAEPTGFTTPDEAMADYVPQDWVYMSFTDDGEIVEYLMGPPASEYQSVVVIARQPDGTWVAEDLYPYVMEEGTDDSPEIVMIDSAADVVMDFVTAIMEDRANDAQALTVPPFSNDPASASFSNGDLYGFSITDAQLQIDGETVEIFVDENWFGDNESYIYTCIPTSNGYRISELRPGL